MTTTHYFEVVDTGHSKLQNNKTVHSTWSVRMMMCKGNTKNDFHDVQ